MAHTNINQATDRQLRQGIAAMRQSLDPTLLSTMTIHELEGLTAHCTRAELLSMATELEARVVARGEAWQAEHRGAA